MQDNLSHKIDTNIFTILKRAKNLLAFSGGIDSTALYYILKINNINFDIAIVNYNTRTQSKNECEYAKKLALKDDRKCYILECTLKNNNFESNARKLRYDFFNSLILKHKYQNLILAHHLNDKLEWTLMQFTKGAGLNTLLGFEEIESRQVQNQMFYVVRPFIFISKNEILDFNNTNNIKYFIDETNEDEKYTRNYFRMNFSNKLINSYKSAIINTFKYLHIEKSMIYKKYIICQDENLVYFKSKTSDLYNIECILKDHNYILSAKQKSQILHSLQNNKDCVIAKIFAITKSEDIIYIGFYNDEILNITIPKKMRDDFRIMRIPIKIRKIMYFNEINRTK